MSEHKTEEIDVLEVLKWAGLAVFLALLAWWIFGNSPSFEQVVSFGFTIFFLVLAIESREGNTRMMHQHYEQTEILKEIKNILVEKLK